jgi:hypothetical protein
VVWLKNTKFLVLDEADEMLFDCRNPNGEAEHGREGKGGKGGREGRKAVHAKG